MEENKVNPNKKLVVIGGSAGSLAVILNNIASINATLPFAMILVLHRKASSENLLEDLLAPRTGLKVKEAEDKEIIENGTLYIAPADYHLLIEKKHTIALDYSERLNYSRPCIDATFETAAEVYGKNLIAVLLSGANSDGTEGLQIVKNHGGTTVAQNPDTAQVSYMPLKAIQDVEIDHILNENEIMPLINKWMLET